MQENNEFYTDFTYIVIVKKCSHAFAFTTFLNIVAVSMSCASNLKLSNLRNGKRFNFDQSVCTPNSGSIKPRRDSKKRPHRV